MSINHSPKVTTDGLVLYYDMPNGKSFVGAPITNLLDNASVNGYPTYGNGWGTYNTNNYGSGTYFSIGTIASVSGNIVTTSAAHPLHTYSVMTPQTSGGGVTAGTNYLIKRLSPTTFTLHAWNGSQDGSQGYINPATGTHKVFDDFANDVRISVSASGFPTMWWGPPHTPNSCLVKELIPGGFTGIRGRAATDCIRLHWIQPDGINDGMAYGPNGPVVAGQVYTVSFWTRSVTPSAVGQSLSYQIYNHGVVAAAGYSFSATLGAVGVWTKQSMTFTPVNPNCISYWFPSTGNMKVDVANIQFEVGSVANNFVAGTRSTTEVIKDLTNNNTLTATSLTYASDGTFSFNGSSNIVTSPTITLDLTTGVSMEMWFKSTDIQSRSQGYMSFSLSPKYINFYSSGSALRWETWINAGVTGGAFYGPATMLNNTWYHAVGTYSSDGSAKLYINGVLVNSAAYTAVSYGNLTAPISIGEYAGYFSGTMPVSKIYNRVLSATEVSQNFQALRGRYGI